MGRLLGGAFWRCGSIFPNVQERLGARWHAVAWGNDDAVLALCRGLGDLRLLGVGFSQVGLFGPPCGVLGGLGAPRRQADIQIGVTERLCGDLGFGFKASKIASSRKCVLANKFELGFMEGVET